MSILEWLLGIALLFSSLNSTSVSKQEFADDTERVEFYITGCIVGALVVNQNVMLAQDENYELTEEEQNSVINFVYPFCKQFLIDNEESYNIDLDNVNWEKIENAN